MNEIFLHNLAEAALGKVFLEDKKVYGMLEKALNDLERQGLKASHIKKLSHAQRIYRKRSGRWIQYIAYQRG